MSSTSWSGGLRLPNPDRWTEFQCAGECGLVERRPILPADRLCRNCRRRRCEAARQRFVAKQRDVQPDVEKAVASAGVPPLYRDCARARMEAGGALWEQTPGLRKLAQWCRPGGRRPEDWMVLIYGSSQRAGCLASAVFRELLTLGMQGSCALMSEWLTELRSGFDRGSGVRFGQVFGGLATAEVLMLLHVQRPESEWGCQQVADLLTTRRVHLRTTIVATGYRRWARIREIHPSLGDWEIREGLRVPVTSGASSL